MAKGLFINLTQHSATAEQAEDGVFNVEGADKETLTSLLTFDVIPTSGEIAERAKKIALLAKKALQANSADSAEWCAMIGGAPYLMGALERALRQVGIRPYYAFSVRESAEMTLPDGSVRKVNSFRHVGWILAEE